jgi:hypothetical protein
VRTEADLKETPMTENEIAKQIVDVAFKTHTAFGPGLLESVYETVMAYETAKAPTSDTPATTHTSCS